MSLKNTDATAGNGAYIENSDSSDHGNSYIGFVNIDHNYAGAITFGTATSGATNYGERMRIDPAGRVGIGTTSPGTLMTIGTSGATAAPVAKLELVQGDMVFTRANAQQVAPSSYAAADNGRLSFFEANGAGGYQRFFDIISNGAL